MTCRSAERKAKKEVLQGKIGREKRERKEMKKKNESKAERKEERKEITT